jgi:hypothetical protein
VGGLLQLQFDSEIPAGSAAAINPAIPAVAKVPARNMVFGRVIVVLQIGLHSKPETPEGYKNLDFRGQRTSTIVCVF